MKWVLIVALTHSISMMEFDDKEACIKARDSLSAVYFFARSVVECYPKGTGE